LQDLGTGLPLDAMASPQGSARELNDSPLVIPRSALARRWALGVLALALVTVGAASATGQAPRIAGDRQGRLLVHGVPRFVLGVYDSGLGYTPNRAAWERMLFAPDGDRQLDGIPINMYLNYQLGNANIPSVHALMDTLWKRRIMYLQTGNCFEKGSWRRYGPRSFGIMDEEYVRQFARHPGAAGYYIMDECADELAPETEQHHRQLKALDPGGITLAVAISAAYRDPALWIDAADVLGIDPYPLYGKEPAAGYTHFMVADSVARLRAAVPAERPIWAVLQFFQFTTDSRQPTYEEMRSHAVMSIVEGAQGLWWWEIGRNGLRKRTDAATVARQMAALRQLVTELARLEPALLAPRADEALAGNSTLARDALAARKAQLEHNIAVEWLYSRKVAYRAELAALNAGRTTGSPMLKGAATIRTLTKVVDGTGYVFAYNYTNRPTPVRFTWRQSPTRVVESRDGRAFAVSSASWEDTFGPYESRIYVVTARGAAASGVGADGVRGSVRCWPDWASGCTGSARTVFPTRMPPEIGLVRLLRDPRSPALSRLCHRRDGTLDTPERTEADAP
jgi:hypothetical protein